VVHILSKQNRQTAVSCFLFLLLIVKSQLTRHQGLSINRAFIFSYTVEIIREKKLFPEYYHKKLFLAIGLLFLLAALTGRLSRTAKTPVSLKFAK
jgi:hypothetical protein